MRAALALLSAVAWLQPPAVLPLPSRTGADGPPRPFGVEPRFGAPAPHTDDALVRAQDHALLYGPFPRDGLLRGVSDGGLMLSESPDVRALTMERVRALGGRVARIPVNWRYVVQAAPPAGFQASDPASPSYNFARIDAAVVSAVQAGLEPLLVVSEAPAFAEAPHRWPYAYLGSWAPSGAALGQFAAALARRYDGSFPDPAVRDPAHPAVLPRVRLFQAWNEPNLARYLAPQWVAEGRRWVAFSPALYRQLLNGFYAGVKSVRPDDTVIAAGIAPEGEPAGVGPLAPLTFLEGLLCLRGVARASCPEAPHLDVLAVHPLSVWDPNVPAVSSLDVAVSDIAKVTRLLARAERLRTVLPAGPHPLWATELNWESAPQNPRHGVPPRLQAAWLSRALHRLWVAGVGLVSWEFLLDPYGGVHLALPGGGLGVYPRPAGLYTAGAGGDPALAQPKPFLRGYTLPFDPMRVNARQVRVWALLMHGRQPALLQRQGRGGWRTIARLRADRYGVLNLLLRSTGRERLRLRVGRLSSAPAWVPWSPSSL